MDEQPKPFPVRLWKEAAAVFVCAATVFSFLCIGFVIMCIKVIVGVDVSVPGEWLAAMLSLASTAIGFLAGSQQNQKNNQD